MTLLVMLLSTLSVWADYGGRCGTSLWYKYQTSTQTLTIYKTSEGQSGSMYDYTDDDSHAAPWKSSRGVIKKVVIDADVTDIGNYAFYNCTALTDVTIASTVTDIGNGAFRDCTSLTSIYIPSNVTRIGNSAFCNCWRLSSITVPRTMTTIEDYAFYDCKALSLFAFPSGVTNISKSVFMGCTSLATFTFSDGVTSIDESAFMGCTALTDISIPNSVTSIGQSAFLDCSALTGISIPNSVTSIGKSAFMGCTALTGISIPNSVTSIEEYAFYNCTSMTSVTISNGVKDIGYSAFLGCSSLTNVTIPNSVKGIGESTFGNCTSLTNVTIPNSVESIGGSAFLGCTSMTSVTISNGVKDIGNSAFLGCTSLTNITIPNSVESIGESAFRECSSMTNVTISNGVKGIGNAAFLDCTSLTNVTIPNSVESIGINAFRNCSSLMTVYCYAAIPPTLGKFTFLFNTSGRKFYVPEGHLADYKESWSDYKNDIVGIPVYTITLSVSPDETFGTATVSSTIAAQGDKVTLTATPKEGYRFIWWESTGGAVITKPSSKHTTLTMPKKNVTLTALFCGTEDNPDTHTLALDPNDGDPMGGVRIYRDIKSYKLPTCTRTGYYFLGWATSAAGDPAYQAGETVNLEGDLTLYAIWIKIPAELVNDAQNATTINKLKDLGAIDIKICGWSLNKDGYWNTLCLPFSLDNLTGTTLEGFTVKELDTADKNDGHKTGSENGTLYLNFKDATSIEAGKPYLVGFIPDLVIRSEADWNTFAQSVTNGTTYAGEVVRLDADISVSTMAGKDGYPFKGMFDGNGHTINLNLSGDGQGLALFYAIEGATIQNMKVTGGVTSSYHRPATFAAFVEGSNTIRNCWSSVDIVSTRTSDWIDGGALVGRVSAGATLTMTDCAFTGSVTYTSTGTTGGGMVGYTQTGATANLTNCLFSPSALTLTVNDYNPSVFVSGNERGNLSNCYYNDVAKESVLAKEGLDATYMSSAELALALGTNWVVSGSNVVPNCSADITNPIFKGVTIKTASTSVTSEDGTVSFTGSYNPVTSYDPNILYIGADNKLEQASAATTINAFRAYFRLTPSNLGDVNGDGAITVTDVMMLVNYVLGNTNDNFILENANVNGDDKISVTDVMAVVKMVLQGNQSLSKIIVNGADGISFGLE